MITAASVIDQVNLFSGLDRTARTRLAAKLRERHFRPGDEVTHEEHAAQTPEGDLRERLDDRGLHVSRITIMDGGYRVYVRGWTLHVDSPVDGASPVLWAMYAADRIARSLGVA